MTEDIHKCGQEVTLNTICVKLENIETDVAGIKKSQTVFMEKLEAILLSNARYPTPEDIDMTSDLVKQHETYMKLLGAGLIIAWGLLLFVLDKVWKT